MTDLCDGIGVRHPKRVSTELLVLMVWTVQPAQMCLAVQRGADLERRGGCCCHTAEGQVSLVGDAGPRYGTSGGESLELRVDLGVRRKVGA